MTARILGPAALLCTIAFCLFVLTSGNIALLGLGALVPLGLVSLGRPDVLFMAVCWTYNSTLRIPGIAGQLELYQLFIVGFVLISAVRFLITGKGIPFAAPHAWAVAFGIVLAATMYARGTGFRVLGENLWGGARYVDIILGLLFFLAAGCVQLTAKQWKWAIVGLIVSGALPALAELLYVFSGGSVYWQYAIFLPRGTTGSALESMEAGETTRFTMLSRMSLVYLVPFLFSDVRRRRLLPYAVFVLLGVFFGGFTGHRIVLLNIVMFIWVFFFLETKRKVAFTIVSAAVTAALLFLAGQFAFFLPSSFQRMLTLVPFARVSQEVLLDAGGSINWRMLLWREAVKLVPEYLWVGKGYAYSPVLAQAHDVRWLSNYAIWWALVQTAYHQGILSLLIGMGLPGLIVGLAFLATACLRHYRFARTSRPDNLLRRIHYVYFILFLVGAFSFLAVYGDVFVSFPRLFFYAAIAEGVMHTLKNEGEREETPDRSGPGSA